MIVKDWREIYRAIRTDPQLQSMTAELKVIKKASPKIFAEKWLRKYEKNQKGRAGIQKGL